jgi:hypothetical protein
MRNLSVVAILLGISVACSNQPAATVPPPTEATPAASVPASPTVSTSPRPYTQSPWSRAAPPGMWFPCLASRVWSNE